ncbi:MAG: HTH-type transcriptional regulator GltC [Syntrophorhabdus sp. PtaU1.Bin153]|nr:MAG: HTH-type transcriptional regulator GltC [Syntrophorhabdus sp. PtaU1.Bin153]
MIFIYDLLYNLRVKRLQINLDQLVTFCFVAKERSLSGAAEKLCVTAPAVTMQVKALESHYGVKLVSVRRKRVYLTKAGNALLPYAEDIYRSGIKAEILLLNYRNNLRLGVSTALTRLFTPTISTFKELHSSVGVTLTEGRSVLLMEGLLEFQYDLCIVGYAPSISDQLTAFRIPTPEKLSLVVSTAMPLARKSQVSWGELHDYPIILHGEGSLSSQLVLREFEKRNVMPLIAASVETMEGMKQLVQQGMGASFMVAGNVEQEVALGKLKIIPIREGGIGLWINILRRKRENLPWACKAFLSLVEKDFKCTISDDF